jgi:hypothetical protein
MTSQVRWAIILRALVIGAGAATGTVIVRGPLRHETISQISVDFIESFLAAFAAVAIVESWRYRKRRQKHQ